MLKTRKRLSKPILVHGLIIVLALVFIQLILDACQKSFLLYMPPIGFAFFLVIQYLSQPMIVGVLNIILLHLLYCCEGWQTGFWLNGLFLFLVFSTITVVLQTIFGFAAWPYITIAEVLLLPYPFGYLGKFSNRGNKTASPKHNSTAPATQS